MDDPVEVEISGVCHGLVRYGVTEKQNIPFVFISFAGALLDVDCYINLLREPADVQDAFTEGMPDNSIVLYIVDLKSGKTVDTRQFTADPSFVRQIQDIAAAQHTAYASADAVEAAATGILADQTSIWLLMGKTKYFTLPQDPAPAAREAYPVPESSSEESAAYSAVMEGAGTFQYRPHAHRGIKKGLRGAAHKPLPDPTAPDSEISRDTKPES